MSKWQRFCRDRWLIILAIPGVLLVLIFSYAPLLGNIVAFKNYEPFIGIKNSPWNGLANFAAIFNNNPEFFNALKNTLILTTLQVGLVFPIPLALALLLNSLMSERLKRLVQGVVFIPYFMSWVIVVAIFQEVLGNTGLVDDWLRSHGLSTLHIIGNPSLFKALITAQVIWKEAGWGTVLFLAALSRVDTELYEAASVDGASRWQQLWYVTLPSIRPVIVLLLILRLGDILTVGFEQIQLQQAAVGIPASDVLDTYVYNFGILGGNWGVGAAVGLVKGVLGLLLVLSANRAAHWFGERGVYES